MSHMNIPYFRALCGVFLRHIVPMSVIFLTSGCAFIHNRYGEVCKTRSYVHTVATDYIGSRFQDGARVRLGVIPYSVPENLAARSDRQPGLGLQIAEQIQAKALEYQAVPIVEVLNREDWPGKRDEFFKGNFGSISMGREAGYDLILVGVFQYGDRLDKAIAYSKLIDVDGGITLWYGRTEVHGFRDDLRAVSSSLGLESRRPDLLYFSPLYEKLSSCIIDEAFRENEESKDTRWAWGNFP
jgi:hypothetical protein